MIGPDLDAPLFITEIEEPPDVQAYSNDYLDNYYVDTDPWGTFKAIMYQMYQDEKEHGWVDDYWNEILEFEDLDDLSW